MYKSSWSFCVFGMCSSGLETDHYRAFKFKGCISRFKTAAFCWLFLRFKQPWWCHRCHLPGNTKRRTHIPTKKNTQNGSYLACRSDTHIKRSNYFILLPAKTFLAMITKQFKSNYKPRKDLFINQEYSAVMILSVF